MTSSQQTIYTLLLWAMPILLTILGFIGALAVQQLIRLSNTVNEIKVIMAQYDEKHSSLEQRVSKLEETS